ncbi:MAG: HAD-IIA family hydrolase [Candidatus Bipolaricaulota bacterium]|nr:MAG: HAD-IIA family hydrolase [Candidatus Bipolaricaulota bacterium]
MSGAKVVVDRRYRGYILDVDGVLVRGGEAIPGAGDALRRLREDADVVLLTNNSTRTRDALARNLAALGLDVAPAKIVTSAVLAARWLAEREGICRVAVLGEEGLVEELSFAGHEVVALGAPAGWVVAGMDRSATYDRLAGAAASLRSGARLLATNDDATYPTPDGPVPGAGAMIGALRGIGYRPEAILGKPNVAAFEAALCVLGISPNEVVVVGDRLETDIAGARNAGLDSILVQTGIARKVPQTGLRPTWSAHDISAVADGALLAVGKGAR